MRNKGNGNKKGGRKKLVNIISKLAKEQLNKSTEDELVEKENVSVNKKDNGDNDDDCVVLVEPPESKRRSKRKPEKTAKSTPDEVVEEPDQMTVEEPDSSEVKTELLDNNLTIVKAVSSEDEFEETPEDENMGNKNENKVENNKTKSNFKRQNDANLKVVDCTACSKNIHTKKGKFCRHPDLNTIICKQCFKFYSSGKFTKDEYGVEEFCRWCADGGQLICCDFCEKAFCKKCIKRNLGKSKLEELLEADEDEKWSCFCCDPAPISNIIKLCNRVMNMLDKEKDQNSPYKDKRGREIIHGPNRSERRNILTNLSEEQSLKNKAKTFPNSKKTYSKCFGNGLGSSSKVMDNNKENSEDNNIENVTIKKEQDDKSKSIVELDEDNEVNSDELSESKKATKSNKKGESVSKIDSSSESDVVQEKSTDQDTNSSSEQETIRSKKKSRDKKRTGKSKSGRKRIDSDSADDFVQAKKKKRTNKKKFAVSSDEESDEETDEHGDTDFSEQESSEPSVKQRRGNNKKNRHDFRSSDSESDSIVADSPKKRKKKGTKKVGKWSLRRKSGASYTSDSESEKENGNKSKSKKKVNKKKLKKKGKLKRKRKKDDDDDDNESDDENVSPSKKGRKKIRKILDNEKLAEATRHARQLEEERRQRLVERTKSVVFEKPDSSDVKELVLEYKSDGKTPLVEVGEDLVRYLKPHQVEGVKFMYDCTIESVERWKKKEPGGGCILAHVMGLGKTLQVVSLVHTLYESSLIQLRRVLVVCPLNTVLNWQVEFEKWLRVDDRLDVYVLNEVKSSNWHRADMLKQWMSYGGILIMGYTMYRNLSQCLRVKSKHQKKIFKECLVDPGPELVVCDEGHVLRNCKSATSMAMNDIKTKRRIVLTGTPLQNNLVEYHCMVSFVKPNLLGTLKEFSNSFIRPIENGQCADSTTMDVKVMKRRCHVLHKMLEGCVQRKDHAEIERFLPPKFEYVIKVRLSTKQREMYKYYLDTFLSDEENKGKGGTLFSDYQALMRIWTHPWSLKLESARQIENFIDSDDSLKDFVVESGEETEVSEEMSWTSDDADSDSDKGKRGKKHWKSASEESEEQDGSEEETPKKTSEKQQQSGKRSDRKERNGNVKGVVKVNPDGPSTSKAYVVDDSDAEDIVEVKPDLSKKAVAENDGASMVYSTLRSGQEFKDPTLVVEEEEWYDKFLTEEDENNVELGSKIVLLLEVLADAAALEEKVLVFSHSLISLDVIEMALGGGEIGGNSEDWCRGCDYFRMDGSTSVQMRKRWADIFNNEENKAARLFLISTKAGGLGINLVGASRVIVFDVSWNPSHDVQSIFRAYRFGQNKPVFVYRFIAEGTMEEKIYDRQVTKLSMSQRVVDEHQIQRHFNANDLAELYRFEPDILENENDERPTPAVPKDAVLAELINRLYPKWIVKYHEHDSLLQNRPEEELTEAERKEAWEQWELEKQGIVNEPKIRAENIQQMMNGVPNSGIPGPRPFTHSGPRVPTPHTLPTFPGVRPPNYQNMVLDEQRRRLFEMEKRRVQEESDRLARANLLRLQQQQRQQQQLQQRQQQQQQQRQRREEEEKRARLVRERAEQQRLQAEETRLREQHRQRAEQQLLREQQRIREQQQRAQQKRAQQQQQREQRQQQEQQRQQQEQQIGQAFLQRLLRNRGAYVTQQTGQGPSNQRVFQVVLGDNADNNPVQSQRQQRSPPRIIELPPDA